MAFPALQAAKRNGGGIFVAFVVVGGGGRGRPSPLHPLWHAVSEEPPPFRLAGRATHQHARAGRQRSGQAVSREGRQAKRNPGLARASSNENALIGDASVTVTLEFRCNQHISRGSVWPRNLKAFSKKLETRYCVEFLYSKRPNGMEVGFSLLSLWLVVAEEAGLHRRIRCGTQCRKSHNHSVWRKEPRINTPGHAGNGQGKQCLARAGRPNGIRDSQGQVVTKTR